MNRTLTLIITTFLATSAMAQNAVKVAYYGESITHYGLKAGYEKSFANPRWLYSGNLAVYRHPHNHIGMILSPEVAWRRTGRKGRMFEAAVAPSLFRYFCEGKTYTAKDDGSFDRIRFAGRTAFLPTVSVGFGKNIWYGRFNVMRQYPYNASSLTRISIEAGIIIK